MKETHPLFRIGGPLLGIIVVVAVVMGGVNQFQADSDALRKEAKILALVGGTQEEASEAAPAAETPAKEEQADAEQAAVSQEFAAPPGVVAAFNNAGCAGCHVVPGIPGANGTVGPNLSTIGADAASRIEGVSAEEYIHQSILDPNAFIAPDCTGNPCPAGVMLQSFAETLDPEQVDTIVGYLLVQGTDEMTALAEASPAAPVEVSASLPPESVLEPFADLPKGTVREAQIALGKYLFFDKRLSGNVSLSCASCHMPDQAFTDGLTMSRGYPSTAYFRNTQSVYNTAFADYRYWDGRMDGGDLPTLVRDHLTEAHFMSMDGRLMVERMRQIPAYVTLFDSAFGGEPSFGKVLNAIAAYVSTLNSLPVAYDQALDGDTSGFSSDELAGYELFTGKAGCSECHSGPLLSDEQFYNLGLDPSPHLFDEPERALTFRRFFRTLGVPDYRNLREDAGLFALTMDQADWGKFNTPSLREIARTAPYMHDGSLAALEDVVTFYNDGGGESQTADLKPLGLSDEEIGQLIAFLESLNSDLPAVETPTLPDYGLLPLGEAEQPAEETAAEVPVNETPAEDTAAAAPSDEAIAAITKGGCGACHVIPGIPNAVGALGPDQSNIGVTAATRIDGYTAEEYIHESIVDPNTFIAPECPTGDCLPNLMTPNFSETLSEDEINTIVSYFLTLDSGR